MGRSVWHLEVPGPRAQKFSACLLPYPTLERLCPWGLQPLLGYHSFSPSPSFSSTPSSHLPTLGSLCAGPPRPRVNSLKESDWRRLTLPHGSLGTEPLGLVPSYRSHLPLDSEKRDPGRSPARTPGLSSSLLPAGQGLGWASWDLPVSEASIGDRDPACHGCSQPAALPPWPLFPPASPRSTHPHRPLGLRHCRPLSPFSLMQPLPIMMG